MNEKSSGGGGTGFVGLLTIVFITLKLTHVIAWSWWWVLSPLWISSRSFSAIALWWTASVRENLSACLTGSREKRGNERCGATQGGDAFPR